jgi:hypothetical protein
LVRQPAHAEKTWTLPSKGERLFDVARLDDIFGFASRFILPTVQVTMKGRRQWA